MSIHCLKWSSMMIYWIICSIQGLISHGIPLFRCYMQVLILSKHLQSGPWLFGRIWGKDYYQFLMLKNLVRSKYLWNWYYWCCNKRHCSYHLYKQCCGFCPFKSLLILATVGSITTKRRIFNKSMGVNQQSIPLILLFIDLSKMVEHP